MRVIDGNGRRVAKGEALSLAIARFGRDDAVSLFRRASEEGENGEDARDILNDALNGHGIEFIA